MPARARTTQPTAKVSLNLDELEKENPNEPFVVTVGGREIAFHDARDLPWDELAELGEDPDEFMWRTLSKEDYDHFKAAKVPGWKIETLIKDYQRHFGISSRGNARGSRT